MASAIRDYLSGQEATARNGTYLSPNNKYYGADSRSRSVGVSRLHDSYSEQYRYPKPVVTPDSEHTSPEPENVTGVNGWSVKATFYPVYVASKPEVLADSLDRSNLERRHAQTEMAVNEGWSSETTPTGTSTSWSEKWPHITGRFGSVNHKLMNNQMTAQFEQWPSRSGGPFEVKVVNNTWSSNFEDNSITPAKPDVSPETLTLQNCSNYNYWPSKTYENSERCSDSSFYLHEERSGQMMAGSGRNMTTKEARSIATGAPRKYIKRKVMNRYKDKNSYCAEIAGILLKKGSIPLAEIYEMYEEFGVAHKETQCEQLEKFNPTQPVSSRVFHQGALRRPRL